MAVLKSKSGASYNTKTGKKTDSSGKVTYQTPGKEPEKISKVGGSSGSKNVSTPVTTPKPVLTYAPGSLETMTVAQAKAAGKEKEYAALVGGYGVDYKSPTTASNVGTTKGAESIVPGKTVTGGYNGVQYYSDGTTSNDYKAPATTSTEIRKTEEIAEKKKEPFEIPETLTYEDYKAKFEPKITKPETPKYEDKYVKLRAEQGIEALEDTINKYDEEAALLEENLRKFKQKEMSGQALGFAQGRISVEQQGIQDQLDFIARQQNAAINKLNTKNKFIETLMNFSQKDYETANDEYQYEFNKNLQMQQMYSTEKNQIRDDARATLTTISNMVANSGKSYNELDEDMKNKVNVLELQAGYPVGTFSKYAVAKPKANIISTSQETDANGNNFVSFISKDPVTGVLSVEKMPTGGVSTSKTRDKDNQADDVAEAVDIFKTKMREKGWSGANPEEYTFYKNYLSKTYGYAAVAALDKAMSDAGIEVDYENK